MWKKIFIFIFLINYVWAAEKVIIYSVKDYPPYSYVQNNELQGIYIDIVKEIDKQIKEFEIELKPIPWLRALKMLESGQAEAILDAWYRPVERPYMIYSMPIVNEEIVIFTINGKGVIWPTDFKDKKIGINRGFATFKEEDKKMIRIEEANSTGDNILKLLNGRIDYYANDKYSVLWEISNLVKKKVITQSEANSIKTVGSLSQENGYIGYRKTSNWPKKIIFMNLVDKEIERMQQNGEIENILKKYLKN